MNESFQGLRDKVDKRIPCNCKLCRTASVPEFFAQRDLLRRKEHNRLKVECPRSFEEVDVLEILDGIRLDKLPGELARDTERMDSVAHVTRAWYRLLDMPPATRPSAPPRR